MDTVNEDVLLQMLDRDPDDTLNRLVAGSGVAGLEGLSIALTYGVSLPQGREFGRLADRKAWLVSEKAKRVRYKAARSVERLLLDEASLVRFVRDTKKRRGYGSVLKGLIKRHHQRRRGEV